jgi:hypothetical protein
VGPTAVLDTAVKRKIPSPRRESNPRTPIVQPVALYCIHVFLKGQHRLRVIENRVLSRIIEPKMEEAASDWRRLHNEELHNLYTS